MKKYTLRLSILAIVFHFFTGSMQAQESAQALLSGKPPSSLRLPAVFGDGMVMQQKTRVSIWGWAPPGQQIKIECSWNHASYRTKSDQHGAWKTKIASPAAGGPFDIKISNGEEQVHIRQIFFGEVWVCSGQSNMEMPLKGYRNQPVMQGDSLIKEADAHPRIHIFRVPKIVSAKPLDDCNAIWTVSNSKDAPAYSAVAYQFALELEKKLNVPVGIICSYWGGTAIQSWMSRETLQQIPGVWLTNCPDTILNPEKDPERSPAILYNSMIAPIAGYTTRGFIWYQGESNRYNPQLYQTLMPVMVKEWRKLWGEGNIPFYYVQIAPYRYNWKNDYFSAFLREAQLKAMNVIPHSGMAVSLDVGKEKLIHPPDKTIISKRLSYWALAKTYKQKNIPFAFPEYRRMKIKGNTVILKFSHAGAGLVCIGDSLINFEVAGSDQVFHPASAAIIGKNKIRVSSQVVNAPQAVRYAFRNWVKGDLYNSDGLPASSFRTDNF
ncbi:MAG TPA: sialate O-acetylesterase [Chitinophagaceae bacterium]|nr:sialate O-acetylesterase [Chitinophagaceae bacterium]